MFGRNHIILDDITHHELILEHLHSVGKIGDLKLVLVQGKRKFRSYKVVFSSSVSKNADLYSIEGLIINISGSIVQNAHNLILSHPLLPPHAGGRPHLAFSPTGGRATSSLASALLASLWRSRHFQPHPCELSDHGPSGGGRTHPRPPGRWIKMGVTRLVAAAAALAASPANPPRRHLLSAHILRNDMVAGGGGIVLLSSCDDDKMRCASPGLWPRPPVAPSSGRSFLRPRCAPLPPPPHRAKASPHMALRRSCLHLPRCPLLHSPAVELAARPPPSSRAPPPLQLAPQIRSYSLPPPCGER
jgi:hypothetical protein